MEYISDSAIISAATLSIDILQTGFYLIKQSILIDEACASVRMEIDSMPTELRYSDLEE
jgi:ATP-dependent Clp protease ATP-binding subunit ClpA